MEVSHPNAKALTPEQQQQLAKLKLVIEAAIADGVLTEKERDQMNAVMLEDRIIVPEELALIQTLIREKIARGELVTAIDWEAYHRD